MLLVCQQLPCTLCQEKQEKSLEEYRGIATRKQKKKKKNHSKKYIQYTNNNQR